MSDDSGLKSFRHGPYLVRYSRDPSGMYTIYIELNGRGVYSEYFLYRPDEELGRFVETVRKNGIDISVDDAREILRKVSQGYDEGVVEGVRARGVECQSLGFITVGKSEYELLRCPDGIDMHFPKNEGEGSVTIYVGVPNVRIIRDKYLKDEVYIYSNSYNQVFVTNDPADLIEFFTKSDKGITSESMAKALIRALLRNAKIEDGYIYEGFYPDGFHDSVLPYPMVDKTCDATVLQRFYEWARENYNENLVYVLANMAFSMAKVFTPAVRMQKDIFEDRIVINTGKKRVGKSTAQKSIISALGLIHNEVRFLGDNPIKTQERLRNLLNINMAPLFLDELMTRGFQTIADMILASVTEASIIGLHASRVGRGFSDVFYSMRSIIISTNLPQGKIIEILGRENIDAYSRRILIMHWKDQKTKAKAPFTTESHLMGCLIELWNNPDIRNELLKANNIFELAMIILKHFFLLYGVDTQPYQEALAKVYNEYVEGESAWEISTEEAVLSEAYRIAKSVLGMSNITPAKLINAVIDNPQVFDVYLIKARYSDRVVEELRRLEGLIAVLGFNISDIEGDAPLTDETAQLLRRLYQLINRDGYWAFLILPNSKNGILKNHPDTFLGRKSQLLDSETAKALGRKRAFKVPITDFVKFILGHREIIEGENELGESEKHVK